MIVIDFLDCVLGILLAVAMVAFGICRICKPREAKESKP